MTRALTRATAGLDQRDGQREPRALRAGNALEHQRPTVSLRDSPRDREPQAAAARPRADERLEQRARDLLGNARPIVDDADLRALAVAPDLDPHVHPRASDLRGVE